MGILFQIFLAILFILGSFLVAIFLAKLIDPLMDDGDSIRRDESDW